MTNTTTTTPSITPLQLSPLPASHVAGVREALDCAQVHHSTLVGHHADVASGHALLTITMSVPVSAVHRSKPAVHAAHITEEAARVFAALDTLTRGRPMTLHSIALNSEEVAPQPSSPLQVYTVEIERELVLRRTVTEEAKVTQTLDVLVVAASQEAADEIAAEHADTLIGDAEDTWLDNFEASDAEWETVEQRHGWEIEVYRRNEADAGRAVQQERASSTRADIEGALDENTLLVQVPGDEDGGCIDSEVNPRNVQELLADLFAELDRTFGGSN